MLLSINSLQLLVFSLISRITLLLGYSVKMISTVGSYASENSVLVIQGYTP